MDDSSGPAGGRLRADVASLAEARPPLGLPVPAYAGRSLPNIAASVLRAAGAEEHDRAPGVPPLADDLDPFRGRRAEGPVVVFLIDGFGWFPFEEWTRTTPDGAAARWSRLARPITTVFPTTTTASLVSLSTAAAPSQHGVVGYRQFLPRLGIVADVLKMTPVGVATPETLVGPEWTPGTVSGVPSIFRQGVDAVAVSRDRFQGSAFTRLLYDGAAYVPYATASDLAHALVELIDRSPPPPVIYTYWDELDTVHHLRGPQRPLFELEAERIAHLLEYVVRHVARPRAKATTVIVSADHGQVPVDPARQLRVENVPEIAQEMARPLAGDRRAGYFAALPGRRAALHGALERHLAPGSHVVPVAQALEAGLFGPPPYHPELSARLGDLIAFVPAPCGIVSIPPGARPPARQLYGGHGGLAPEELIVPLLAGALGEFGPDDRSSSRR